MVDEPTPVEVEPVHFSHLGNPVQPQFVKNYWRAGQSGNPKGKPKGLNKAKTVTDHLLDYFSEIVKREVPDGSGNTQVVEITRMELLAKLIGSRCFSTDGDPAFRRDCLKAVLDRVDPVESKRDWEPFVEAGPYTTDSGRNFITELERAAGFTPVTPQVVLAVLQRGNGNGRALGGGGTVDEEQHVDGGGI